MLDSLIALALLALGLVGLAGVQMHMLAELRTTTSRGVANTLINDLGHRMSLNREAASGNVVSGQAVAGGTPFAYALAWGAQPTAAANCAAVACTAAQMATHDLDLWSRRVPLALPGGSATVFQSATDPRQVGIAIAWSVVDGKGADGDAARHAAPFGIAAATHGVDCPANRVCHLVYVQP